MTEGCPVRYRMRGGHWAALVHLQVLCLLHVYQVLPGGPP